MEHSEGLTLMLGHGPIGSRPITGRVSAKTEADATLDAVFEGDVYEDGVFATADLPAITLKAVVLDFGGRTGDGRIVRAVALPWFDIVEIIRKDPNSMYEIDPFKWEDIIAGAYTRDGYDVVLTPRSGDNGRDIIATKAGYVRIRLFDQIKAYKPSHRVTAEEIRAMIGVLSGAQNVSKGLITTTSDFAPRIADDPFISHLFPSS